MEYRTELSLDENIQNLINRLSNTNAFNLPNLEELNDHLLDETEHLIKTGLSEEESFIIASKRLGSFEVITSEFNKINNSFYSKITPYLKGILIYFTIFLILDLLNTLTHFIVQPTLNEINAMDILLITKLALFIPGIILVFITIRSKKIKWRTISEKLTLSKLVGFTLLLTLLKSVGFKLVREYSIINYDQTMSIEMNYSYFETIALLLIFMYSLFINIKTKRANKLKVIS